MSTKRILYPTDFSHASDDGLEYAASLARDMGATLLIVHVEEPPVAYAAGEMYYGIPNPDRRELESMLSAVKPKTADVNCEYRLLQGDPAHEIVTLADEGETDMIVMGTHGRTGLSRLLMGSVAEAIVRRANCPVLTFKPEQISGAAQDQKAAEAT